MNHGKWLPSESQAFKEALEFFKYSLNWHEISEYVGTRTSLQCKERYEQKYQYPDKYLNWTIEEDFKLFFFYKKFGGKWAKTALFFQGRTENKAKILKHYEL